MMNKTTETNETAITAWNENKFAHEHLDRWLRAQFIDETVVEKKRASIMMLFQREPGEITYWLQKSWWNVLDASEEA